MGFLIPAPLKSTRHSREEELKCPASRFMFHGRINDCAPPISPCHTRRMSSRPSCPCDTRCHRHTTPGFRRGSMTCWRDSIHWLVMNHLRFVVRICIYGPANKRTDALNTILPAKTLANRYLNCSLPACRSSFTSVPSLGSRQFHCRRTSGHIASIWPVLVEVVV